MRKRILVKGPAMSRSGYGEQCRFALRALKQKEDLFDIYLENISWGNTGWIQEDDEERQWLDSIFKKTINYRQAQGQYDISLQVTIPNEWEKIAPVNIGYTAGIETTKVSPQWIEKSFLMDKIIVVSNHAKQVYESTTYDITNKETGEIVRGWKTNTPIDVVNYCFRDFEAKELDLELENDFNFLVVSQIGPRKNVGNTIQWFVEEFIDQPLGLVIKGFLGRNGVKDKYQTEAAIANLLSKYPQRKCSVHLLHGHMTDKEMAGLYSHPKIKAMITLTHGEGFGLPLFEAAYNELPVMAPDWSGHCDFLFAPVKDKKGKVKNKAMFAKLDYTIAPVQKEAVWDGVVQEDSQWCFPEQGSYKMKLREMFKDIGRFEKQAKKLKQHIVEEFTPEKQYTKFCDSVYEEEDFSVDAWLSNLDEKVYD